MGPANDLCFGYERNPEPIFARPSNILGKLIDVFSYTRSVVDQNQSVLAMHPYRSHIQPRKRYRRSFLRQTVHWPRIDAYLVQK